MPGNLLDNLDVFYGELTPARATVYARLEGLDKYEGLSLAGFVRGPRCFYSKTLPATFRLQDAGPGPSLLAKSLVPDPCYWSPETPHIYDVTVELRKGADIIASEVRQIGFKPLGTSGRFFTWEGRPWVLRGVSQCSTNEQDIALWHENSAVLCEHSITDVRLTKASEQGVLCYCSLPRFEYTSEKDVLASLRRLAKFPAVALVSNIWAFRKTLQRTAPNVLLVEHAPLTPPRHNTWSKDSNLLLTQGAIQPFDDSAVLQSHASQVDGYTDHADDGYADQHHVTVGYAYHVDSIKKFAVPILIYRSLPHPKSFAKARRACDKLQADLAPDGQFAGYIV